MAEVRKAIERGDGSVFAVLRPARPPSPAATVTVTFDRRSGSVIPKLVASAQGRTPLARFDVGELIAEMLAEHRGHTSFAALALVVFGNSPSPRVALGVSPPSPVVNRWAEAIGLDPR